MWCENCNLTTPNVDLKIRITKDGKEIVSYRCEVCLYRTEIEYSKADRTVRVKDIDKNNG